MKRLLFQWTDMTIAVPDDLTDKQKDDLLLMSQLGRETLLHDVIEYLHIAYPDWKYQDPKKVVLIDGQSNG
jgi:hypothetical protein